MLIIDMTKAYRKGIKDFRRPAKGSSETTIFAFAHSGTSSNRFGTFLPPLTAYNESTYSSSKGIIYANPHPLRRTAGFFNRCPLPERRIHAAIRQPVRRRRLHAKPAFEARLTELAVPGGNASPALSWKNPPAGTKSFVLTVYDKDAPTGLGWMHRVVADIPADVHRRNATSLQLSHCASIADRTGLDALGGRRHSRRCPPPQRGLAQLSVRCANIADDQSAAISAVISLRICRIRLLPSYTANRCRHAATTPTRRKARPPPHCAACWRWLRHDGIGLPVYRRDQPVRQIHRPDYRRPWLRTGSSAMLAQRPNRDAAYLSMCNAAETARGVATDRTIGRIGGVTGASS